MKKLLGCLIVVVLLLSCKDESEEVRKIQNYEGPLMQMNNVVTLFSDSAKVKVKLIAKVQDEYQNGDRIFPKGLVIFFFDSQGDTSSTLIANHGKYSKEKDTYTGTGNVIIRDLKEGKTMKTELLNWNPSTKKVFTDKFVRIQTATEILTGNGLDANQDFKYYKIRNPTGVFSVNK
jgi:LPS export ABC transporter protein LptC